MKCLVRINGNIREDVTVSMDIEMGLLILDIDGRNIVKQKDKGIFAEVNLYGDFEGIDQGTTKGDAVC